MSSRPQSGRSVRWLQKRIASKGLRPRYAAYVIVEVWSVSVVVFGVVEHLVDPDTFRSVWLGMWWGVETVTTVGYGDVTPKAIAGRIVAGAVMLEGIAFVAIVTAAVTSTFVARAAHESIETAESAEEADQARIDARFDDLAKRLDRLESAVDRLARSRPDPSNE